MRPPILSRKSKLPGPLDKISDLLGAPGRINSSLRRVSSDNARKAGLLASALTALTAGSAGVSSLRRRNEGARDNS
jgi:hypothetical protein